jgi:hypothetical protein
VSSPRRPLSEPERCQHLTRKKTTYRSAAKARRAIRAINDKGDGRDLRAYQCARCGGWHLTSHPQEGTNDPRV